MRRRYLHHYHLAPDGGSSRSFKLSEGQNVLGTLTIADAHGGAATIRVDGAELDITRTSPLRKNLALRRRSDSEAICFSANLLSGGKINTHGEEYCWAPANIRWSAWFWKTKRGKVLMRVGLRHSFAGLQGEVRSEEPLSEPWRKELALLGWYLLSLSRASFGAHAISALEVYAGRI